jgi:hypothetical protein
MATARLEPREVDRIRGMDYSNGKRYELILFTASPAG